MHTPFIIATLIIMQPDRTKCKRAAPGAVVPGASASTWLSAAAAALLAAAAGPAARAQEYPSKPVVIVVPAAAGGPTDTLARNLGVVMGGGAVHEHDPGRVHHGAVQGHGAGDDRPGRRQGRLHVRPDHQYHAADQGWDDQGLRRDLECARALAAGGPHARRAELEGLRAG